VNPQLLVCLLVSALVGIGAAALVVLAGWGVLSALTAYMTTASIATLAVATVFQPGDARLRLSERPVPNVAAERVLVRV
jgi:Na+/H+-dicarboxylate symporter